MTNPFCKNIHIFNDLRFKEVGMGSSMLLQNDKCNIVRVSITKRSQYINLFENLFPQEIIYFLNNYFWNGMFDYDIYIDEKIQEILKENDYANLMSFLVPELISSLIDRKDYNLNNHHILPRSRISDLSFCKDNIIKINRRKHKNYHYLFDNRTPGEIVQILNKTFWNNSFFIVLTPQPKMKEMLKTINGHNLVSNSMLSTNLVAPMACAVNNQQI